ncbi:hypothetical protein BC835DRAFT_1374137 [Cytidiella melzeri]|nr:hypothetical protein BC835DRAFT_1374137 [Cytidiella melzeri]
MATQIRQVRGLHKLPNELLMAIGEMLYASEPRSSTRCIHFTATLALSRVSRRLRMAMLPLLFRKLTFRHAQAFFQSLLHFSSDGEMHSLASSVKSICILNPRDRAQDIMLVDATNPFTNLTTFECAVEVGECFLLTLSRTTRLKSLAITCTTTRALSTLEGFASLETLRVNARPVSFDGFPRLRAYSHRDSSYTSITTLALHNCPSSIFVDECIGTCHFPNLLSLKMKDVETTPVYTFLFIQRHPTLLQVNANWSRACIRLEALLKLIDGTGTWYPSSGSKFCSISYNWAMTTPPFPPNIVSGVQVACSMFGFTRVPIHARAASWKSPAESLESQYICTALLMDNLKVKSSDQEDDNALCKVTQALSHLSVATPYVEELRLALKDRPVKTTYMAMATEMVSSLVGKLGHLRKLAICWWGASGDIDRWETRTDYIPLLDGALPPFDWYHFGYGGLMEEPEYPGYVGLAAGIRAVLRIDDEDQVDEDDDTLALRAWEERHKHSAARVVRTLAASCDTLEEFDWFFSGAGVEERSDSAVWTWKIRREDEKRRKIQVFGTLRWHGGLGAAPPHFWPLVGQESSAH